MLKFFPKSYGCSLNNYVYTSTIRDNFYFLSPPQVLHAKICKLKREHIFHVQCPVEQTFLVHVCRRWRVKTMKYKRNDLFCTGVFAVFPTHHRLSLRENRKNNLLPNVCVQDGGGGRRQPIGSQKLHLEFRKWIQNLKQEKGP